MQAPLCHCAMTLLRSISLSLPPSTSAIFETKTGREDGDDAKLSEDKFCKPKIKLDTTNDNNDMHKMRVLMFKQGIPEEWCGMCSPVKQLAEKMGTDAVQDPQHWTASCCPSAMTCGGSSMPRTSM